MTGKPEEENPARKYPVKEQMSRKEMSGEEGPRQAEAVHAPLCLGWTLLTMPAHAGVTRCRAKGRAVRIA